jgi:tripartite-type tricarboxylate transporter receptor subunit TctC
MTLVKQGLARRSLLQGIAATAAGMATLGAFKVGDALSASAFYSGKQVRFDCPSKSGGGSDLAARFLASWVSKKVDGNPTVQVFNSKNTIIGGNTFAGRPADGQSIFISSASTQLPWLLGQQGVSYDFKAWHPIAGFPLGGVVYVGGKSPIKSIADLGKHSGLVYGGESAVSGDTTAILALKMLDVGVKFVMGYEGQNAERTALLQGELDFHYDSSNTYLAELKPEVANGDIVPLFTFGFLGEGNKLVRDPLLPDLPNVAEAYKILHGKDPSGPDWEAYQGLMPLRFILNKAIWIRSDSPAEAKTAMDAGFAAMVADPEFQKAKAEQLGPYDVFLGQQLAEAVASVNNISPQTVAYLKDWLSRDFQATF